MIPGSQQTGDIAKYLFIPILKNYHGRQYIAEKSCLWGVKGHVMQEIKEISFCSYSLCTKVISNFSSKDQVMLAVL